MNSKLFWLSPFPCLLSVIILVFIEFPLSLSNPELYASCGKPFKCGNITTGYPFWGGDRLEYCGHPGFELSCESGKTMIEINDVRYRVINVNDTNQILKIARLDYLLEGICPRQLENTTTLDPNLFELVPGYDYFTLLYGCPSYVPEVFSCPLSSVYHGDGSVEPGSDVLEDCNTSVTVLLPQKSQTAYANLSNLQQALNEGFQVKWNVDMTVCLECIGSKGICSTIDVALNQSICYCPNNDPSSVARKCPQKVPGVPQLDNSDYAPGYWNLTIHYGCTPSLARAPSQFTFFWLHPSPFTCPINGVSINGYVQALPSGLVPCIVPIPQTLSLLETWDSLAVEEAFKEGFELKWKVDSSAYQECTESNGTCGFDPWSQTTCCYPSQPLGWFKICSPPGSKNLKFVVGFVIALSAAVTIILIFALRRKPLPAKVMIKRKTVDDPIEAFVKSYGTLTLKRYSYADTKKMTKSFTDKLGQGGYGGVYKGKLPDGRPVAVKILSELKGNGEEFINEVASISRTSHVNVVTLVGFCYERTKRALIYEFMPNGSLDKFIYDQESSHACRNLQWETLYQIAVGIARGLEYLHRGCNTRIVHFDIKPHNILLDEDLCPKISDFGLAKLCTRKESIVSMVGARGTAGYIAPEVFCRSFGGVSHKSDVYSYGMMVLEIVGGRKNINVGVSNTSEIYFPHWIYKQLEPGKDLRLHGDITEQEEEIARKMIIVGLWCIQINPLDRPSMTKVVEMLEGSFQSLQIPPMPTLSSPRKSPEHSSSISSS